MNLSKNVGKIVVITLPGDHKYRGVLKKEGASYYVHLPNDKKLMVMNHDKIKIM